MEFENHFEQNIKQLIHLLKKILSGTMPYDKFPQFPQFESFPKDQNFNLNLCFVTIFPPFPDDESLDDFAESAFLDPDDSHDLADKLDRGDLEFFRRHGIQF